MMVGIPIRYMHTPVEMVQVKDTFNEQPACWPCLLNSSMRNLWTPCVGDEECEESAWKKRDRDFPQSKLEETRHRKAGNKNIGKTFECLRSEWG